MIYNYNSTMCNRSSMHQCLNSSKCISIHRLMDGIHDCPLMDDETMFEKNNTDLFKQLQSSHYQCETSNKSIHKTLIENGICDCGYNEYRECDR